MAETKAMQSCFIFVADAWLFIVYTARKGLDTMNITWVLKPMDTPLIHKNCGRCGKMREFACSKRFRVNAQQRRLDVWLIYHCTRCGATWNMDILSRVKPEDMDRTLYEGFLKNDEDLAYRYAFDAGTLARNRANACHEKLRYTIEGPAPSLNVFMLEPVTLRIQNPYGLHLRLDKLMQEKTGIPRAAWKAYFQSAGKQNDGRDTAKANLNGDATLLFKPEQMIILLSEKQLKQTEIFLPAADKT